VQLRGKGGVIVKKKIVLLTVTLLLVFGIAQVAGAAGMGWGGGPMEALNLTEQQMTQMRQINQDTYNQTRELRIKLMDSMHELKQMQLQQNPDKTKMEAKIQEIKQLRDKIQSIHQEKREKCRSLLTQEQRNQMNQFRGKMGGGFKGGYGAGNMQ